MSIGELLALVDDGRTALVRLSAGAGDAAVRARSTVDLHGAHIGKAVVLMFENADLARPIVMGVLVTLIRTLREALGLTTVIVSHDIHETLSIADYIYVLADGKVIGEGTPEELKRSESPFIQQFLNGHADGPVRFRFPAPSFADEIKTVQDKTGGRR